MGLVAMRAFMRQLSNTVLSLQLTNLPKIGQTISELLSVPSCFSIGTLYSKILGKILMLCGPDVPNI